MRCIKCGQEIPDGSKFCRYCGAKQEEMPKDGANSGTWSADESSFVSNNESFGEPLSETPKGKNSVLTAIVAIIIVCLLVIGGGAGYLFYVDKTSTAQIDIDPYVTVNFEGNDGNGTATCAFDKEKFAEDNGKEILKVIKAHDKATYATLKKLHNGDEVEMADAAANYICAKYIDVDLDKDSDLSNGGKVALDWKIDGNLKDNLKCTLNYTAKQFEVKGLSELIEVNPFDDIEVTFNGESGNGYAEYDFVPGSDNADVESDMYFKFDKSSDLTNGETITLTLDTSYYTLDDYAERYGKKITETSKDYTVSGLTEYVAKISEISDEAMEDMKETAESEFKDSFEAGSTDSELKSMTYLGCILEQYKDSYNYNKVLLVYKIKAKLVAKSGSKKVSKNQTYYWTVGFSDVKNDGEGETCVDLSGTTKTYNSFTTEKVSGGYRAWWYITGYKSLKELYNDVVKSEKDRWKLLDIDDAVNVKKGSTGDSDTPFDNDSKDQDSEDQSI